MARVRRLSARSRVAPLGERRRPLAAHVLAAISMIVVACSSRLASPRVGTHPAATTTYVEVPYPPPPARVEVIPPPPREAGAVWLDGEWAWLGKGWSWQTGGWVVPPADAYFAPWLVYRLENGRLLFASGAWHLASGERLPNPVVLEAARNGLGEEKATAEPPRVAPAASR